MLQDRSYAIARTPTGFRSLAKLPAEQRMAWRALAIDVYRGHDRIFSQGQTTGKAYDRALRRLKAALPSLRLMVDDPLLEDDDRDYVLELIKRVERCDGF